MPWTRTDLGAWMRLSDTAPRQVEAATCAIPCVPLSGRGASPIDRYDEDEVRAWWARRVADARGGRLVRASPKVKAPRPGRPALRLPFAVG